MMNVLVACEESQEVCKAFRKKGHNAFSCDMQEPSGGHPEWHILGDALEAINGGEIVTMDGTKHNISKWDLLIAHPPCTYLSNAGAARLYKRFNDKSYVELERLNKGFAAKEFFLKFLNAPITKIAVENPIPSGVYRLPKYSQVIQPYEYGHPYSKKTCLWLKGLPKLEPTEIVEPICSWVSGGSKKSDGTPRENKGTSFRDSKRKSKTFPGIAKAMAEQWGGGGMIICDSREQKNAHILRYFERHNVPYVVRKMETADYMIEGQPNIVVDRKQNLDEICANLTYKGKKAAENGGKDIPSNVARFWREVRRAYEDKIKLVVLIEHGENVKCLADVAAWGGSRSGISGRKLIEEMDRLTAAYGVEWQFCTKAETAEEILKILNFKGENYYGQNHN